MATNGEPDILLDCDVVIHFLKGGRILELPKIFPGRFVMLDKIRNELYKRNGNLFTVGILEANGVSVIPMPNEQDIIKEYFQLKKTMDDGEAACLAVARFKREYVASSNITQIATYCQHNGITYYTTMDLLHEATVRGVMSDAECNLFITEVKASGSKLPCNTIAQYRTIKGIVVVQVQQPQRNS